MQQEANTRYALVEMLSLPYRELIRLPESGDIYFDVCLHSAYRLSWKEGLFHRPALWCGTCFQKIYEGLRMSQLLSILKVHAAFINHFE